MLKDCVGIRAKACKPPAKTFTSSTEGEKINCEIRGVFDKLPKGNYRRKARSGYGPQGSSLPGTCSWALYEGAAIFQCCVPRCDAEEKRTCVSSRHGRESALQRHTANCTRS